MVKIVSGVFIIALSLSAWQKDGVPVCTAPGLQWRCKAELTTAGRVAITWEDGRSDTLSKVYLQVLDSLGNPLFAKDGIRVSQRAGTEVYHQTVTHGSDLFIAWEGAPGRARINTDIFVTKIDGLTGVKKWGDIPVCTADGDQYEPQLCLDGSGEGAWICWTDYRSGNADVWAARVTQNGQVAWEKKVGPGAPLQIITSGNDAIIIDSYLLWKIDSTGNFQWDSAGIPAADTVGDIFSVASDQRGGIIVFFQAGDFSLRVQRIDTAGERKWGNNGVSLQTSPLGSSFSFLRLQGNDFGFSEDGFGGCLVSSYRGIPTEHQVYRVDSSGTNRWPSGVVVWTSPGEGIGCSTTSDITYDNLGGCIATWSVHTDSAQGYLGDIVAQRVDKERRIRFQENGLSICSDSADQRNPVIISVSGGAILCWEDMRNGNTDIFAQFVDTLGNVGIDETSRKWQILNEDLLSIEPNPFSKTMKISSENRAVSSEGIKLNIYDVAGKLVKSFNLTNYHSPVINVIWDGRSDASAPVAPGVYFCRLETKDYQTTKKLIRLK